MLASPGPLPTGEGWAYEVKWDGVRALVATGLGGGRPVRSRSRSGRESTAAYPELQQLDTALGGRPAVLDGELVALDASGRPSFERLQPRMLVTDPIAARRLADEVPATFLAFDLLALDGRSLLDEPYDDRRAALEELAPHGLAVPPAFLADGAGVLSSAREQGLEGVVAKRRAGRYEPGRRSGSWTKVRVVNRQDCVVGGWRPGVHGRAGSIGALLIGVPGVGGLRYAGRVGSGLSDAALALLQSRFGPLARPHAPFTDEVPRVDARTATWLEPVLVATVEHSGWTSAGRLRHPRFRGLRDDVTAADVVIEQPAAGGTG